MRALNAWIDRFCYKHPRFGIPNLMLYIIIGNIAVYFMDMVSNNTFSNLIMFWRPAILHGQIWRLVSFIFVPSGGNLLIFAINLYFCYLIGSTLEREWGAGKFTMFYLAGVIANIIVGFIIGYSTMNYFVIAMFLAFATLYPDVQFLFFFIIPVKAKWLAIVFFGWYLFDFIRAGMWIFTLFLVAAALVYLLFFWDEMTRRLGWVRHRTSAQTIQFRKAARKVQQQKGYLHKCAVCGKTDADYPDMEFRYCSKCKGYYCYCMDHINNHVHITE